ncbi:MAG: hypothetical protein ACR2OH_01105 [Microthrixaceae bacterium]
MAPTRSDNSKPARHRAAVAFALLAACALALAACGNDDEPDTSSKTTTTTTTDDTTSTTSSTTESTTPAVPTTEDTPVNSADELGPLQFELTTANDDVTVRGSTDGCTNPSETTLDVTFSDGTNEVVVVAENGEGSVIIPGLFEGTIDEIAVGDTGNVTISGRGGLADDSAEATTFEVLGNCI